MEDRAAADDLAAFFADLEVTDPPPVPAQPRFLRGSPTTAVSSAHKVAFRGLASPQASSPAGLPEAAEDGVDGVDDVDGVDSVGGTASADSPTDSPTEDPPLYGGLDAELPSSAPWPLGPSVGPDDTHAAFARELRVDLPDDDERIYGCRWWHRGFSRDTVYQASELLPRTALREDPPPLGATDREIAAHDNDPGPNHFPEKEMTELDGLESVSLGNTWDGGGGRRSAGGGKEGGREEACACVCLFVV